MKLYILTILFFLIFSPDSFGQRGDSIQIPDTSKVKKHSAKMATIMSAVIPGLGQVYNKKYWKVPVIYGALLSASYSIQYNRSNYLIRRDAYIARIDEDSLTTDISFPESTSDQQILSDMEFFHKWLEVSYIALGLVYVLNVVDATVDAHLFTFDVSDDLSLRLIPEFRPEWYGKHSYPGVRLTLNF